MSTWSEKAIEASLYDDRGDKDASWHFWSKWSWLYGM